MASNQREKMILEALQSPDVVIFSDEEDPDDPGLPVPKQLVHPGQRLKQLDFNMVMKYEETAELSDKSACAGVRADLKMCLLESECCKDRKKTPRECLQTHDPGVPEECLALRNLLFECKRSMLDNRTRFRGRRGY